MTASCAQPPPQRGLGTDGKIWATAHMYRIGTNLHSTASHNKYSNIDIFEFDYYPSSNRKIQKYLKIHTLYHYLHIIIDNVCQYLYVCIYLLDTYLYLLWLRSGVAGIGALHIYIDTINRESNKCPIRSECKNDQKCVF